MNDIKTLLEWFVAFCLAGFLVCQLWLLWDWRKHK